MKQFFTWRSAILQSNLASTTKLVLLVISTYMDDHGGGAFPSQEKVAEMSGLSREAVNRHIKKAVDKNYLNVRKLGLSGRKWAQNYYTISFPENPEKIIFIPLNDDENDNNKVVTDDHKPINKVVIDDHIGSDRGSHRVVTDGHTNSPINSPINSPSSSLEEKPENQNINNLKKGKQENATKYEIDEVLNPDKPIPTKYLEAARRKCSASQCDIENQYSTWFHWNNARDHDKRTAQQWFSSWISWVCKNLGGESPNGGNKAGPAKSAVDALLTASRKISNRYHQQSPESKGTVQ